MKQMILAAVGGLILAATGFSQTRWMRLYPDVSRQYLERWEEEHQWLTPAREGRIHFQKHEVGRARERLEAALAEGAVDGRLLYELGYSCRMQGDDPAALRYLEEASAFLARDDPGHLYHFNSLYLSGLIREEMGEPEAALARYEAALRLRPEVAALGYRRAYLLYRRGEMAKSRAEIARILEREPDSAAAAFLAGLLALEAGDFAAAEIYLERARAAGVEPAPVHYALGYIALRRGDPAAAIAAYEAVLAADPAHRDALAALANLSYREDDLDRSRRYFELLVRRVPTAGRWHYNLGIIYRDLGLDDLSRGSLAEARRLDPSLFTRDLPGAGVSELFVRAGKLQAEGKYRTAAELYREALAEDPFFIPGHFNRAVCLRAAGEGRAALGQYGRLLRIDPDYGPARLNAGVIALELKDRPAAGRHLRRYLILDPDSPQSDLVKRYLREMRGW